VTAFRWRCLKNVVPVARRVARHTFVEAWLFWLMLGGFGVAAALFRVRGAAWAAAFLEVAGLGTVAWGFHRLRTDFRHPGLVAAALAWFRRFPALLKPQTIDLEGHAHAGARVSGHATVTVKPRAGLTIDERVTRLERELEGFRESHARDLTAVRERVDGVAADVARERDDRTRENAALKRTVEDLAVGGLNLEAVGLAWLVVGVLLGTLW
jgi:hypothetical protein